MKQIFSIIMLAAATLFAACEPTADEGMVITSGKEYIVEANGGDVYVTYTGVSGVNTTVIEGQEFISSVKTPAVGIVVINVKANTTEAARTAIVDIKSTDGDFNQLIILRQKGSNINTGGNAMLTSLRYAWMVTTMVRPMARVATATPSSYLTRV